MFWFIYLVSVFYCIYKMYKSYRRTSTLGGIGASPGLETLAIIVMAPVLMLVDVVLTWVRLFNEYNNRDENKIF